MARFSALLCLAALLSGCGAAVTQPQAPVATRSHVAAKDTPAGDMSSFDRDTYKKIAALYCLLHYDVSRLDYAGSDTLDEQGFVVKNGAGWTFGAYHRPGWGKPEQYCVIRVDQHKSISEASANLIAHKGDAALDLSQVLTPAQVIHVGRSGGLPKGDHYAVEYLSATADHAQLALVTALEEKKILAKKALDAYSGEVTNFQF